VEKISRILPRAIAPALSIVSNGDAAIPMGYQMPKAAVVNGSVVNCAPSPAPSTADIFSGKYLESIRVKAVPPKESPAKAA